MEMQALDRRILKAFYTQYVAVLLIILTFTIGAFQRVSTTRPGVTVPEFEHTEPLPLGDFEVEEAFAEGGAVRNDNEKLRALAAVARNHDVVLEVRLPAPRLSFEEDSASIRRALRRIAALEQFFASEEVPQDTVRFRVEDAAVAANGITISVIPHDKGGSDDIF